MQVSCLSDKYSQPNSLYNLDMLVPFQAPETVRAARYALDTPHKILQIKKVVAYC